MPRAPKTPRTQVLAIPRPSPAVGDEWMLAAMAVAVLLLALVL